MRFWLLSAVSLQLLSLANANTEKTIFLAPNSVTVPSAQSGLDSLCLDLLTPTNPSLNTQLDVAFASDEEKKGTQSWYLLEGLSAGQRYEVRVCWAATQPTDFWLDTFTLPQVFETPELISALGEYSEERQGTACSDRKPKYSEAAFSKESVLFLRIYSAADFYSPNQTLMQQPPPVLVDIILDPYILNVLPRSLLPTIGLIVIVAVGAWILSGMVWNWLQALSRAGEDKAHVD